MKKKLQFALVWRAIFTSVGLALMTGPGAANAQTAPLATDAPKAGEIGEITVTARRRDETLQSVPVTVTAVPATMLENSGVTDLEGVARLVPQLFLGRSSGSFQGGVVGLRGISAGDGNVFSDQAVAFNIDGVLIARSLPRQLSAFDLQQVEVLKGPQALYFGKNSPGGVVSIDTADPTKSLQASIRSGYEINAHQWREEGFVSGPLTDFIGVRVAFVTSTMRGWVTNDATQGTIYSPPDSHIGHATETDGRVTLKFDDGGPLKARLKLSYGKNSTDGQYSNQQTIYCPLGHAQLSGPNDDCKPDDQGIHPSLGTRFGSGGANTVTGAAIPGQYFYGNGQPYSDITQDLSGLELNYALNDSLAVASTTGYWHGRVTVVDNFNVADPTFAFDPARGPAAVGGMAATYADLNMREVSQEFRLTSSYNGPVNFMAGGYFQNQKLVYLTAAAVNALNPISLFPPASIEQDGTAYSGFGSVSYKPIDAVEISGGARYSRENKDFSLYRVFPGQLPASQGGAVFVTGAEVPTAVPERTFSNVSPEGTITWRPNGMFTVYGGWKRGFISGGFNGAANLSNVAILGDQSYDPETVDGYEGGLKTNLFNGSLHMDLAAFDYKVKGLQVTSSHNTPTNSVQTISNAAGASSKGVEGDFNWQTPWPGFSLNGSVAYDKAIYTSFSTSPCQTGQTISQGCNGNLVGATFTTQNLTGAPLLRAPKVGASLGSSYEIKYGNGNVIGFAADGSYSSGFFTDALNTPGGYQRQYWLLDASTRYELANGLEIAFIGRNLTNTYYVDRTSSVVLTGGPSGVATSFRADMAGVVSRGRELWLQGTYHFH